MSDVHLYKKMKAGSQTAFDQLFHLYYENLVRIAYKKTQSLADAEDIVQTIFIEFWTKRNEQTIEKSVIAYLSRTVHHRCIDYFRKQKSIATHQKKHLAHSLNLEILSPEEVLLNQENLTAIYNKIEALPPKCKIVFKLSRFEELSYEEIAAQLEISTKTVEYHISKALGILRKGVFFLVLFLIQYFSVFFTIQSLL